MASATALCALTAPTASAAAPPTYTAPPAYTSARHISGAAAHGHPVYDHAKPAKEPPGALYGKGDPKYDGVWRQSLALLALDAAGAEPARKAVDWLARQQCDDGSFTAYRADTGKPCDAKKTPGDTNATGAAVQALAATGGQEKAVRKALAWLDAVQNKDGGWGYNPGGPSDANSVSVVVGAYAAAGKKPEKAARDGKSPYDALTSLQLGCDAKKSSRGAFAYQPGKDGELAANDDATAAAVLAGAGSGLRAEAGPDRPLKPLSCDKGADGEEASERGDGGEAAQAGAAYLASVLDGHGGHLLAATPGAKGAPDYANTADAVIALAAAGHRAEARKSLDWLAARLGSWDKAQSDPAAIAGVMLAVHATGGDAATLKGTKLLDRLVATGPKPARMPDGEQATGGMTKEDDGSGVLRWSLLGAGLAAGAGVGFLISARRKRER
nr:terpene cyclase/mutase family protein [Streptomyces marispadix]